MLLSDFSTPRRMYTTVTGLIATAEQLDRIEERLSLAGFPSTDVSVLIMDGESGSDGTDDRALETMTPEVATAGVGAGGLIGATIGWFSATGNLLLPGLGSLMAAGPVLATLAGAMFGATFGGLTGALIGLEVPAHHSRLRPDGKRDGIGRVAVRACGRAERDIVCDIFERAGADVLLVEETSVHSRAA